MTTPPPCHRLELVGKGGSIDEYKITKCFAPHSDEIDFKDELELEEYLNYDFYEQSEYLN